MSEPNFIERDAQTIIDEMVADYESRVGKTLQPAQVEMMLIKTFAYRELLLRIGIQETGKQNLLAFSTATALDYLGELLGVLRLPAAFASTTLLFTIVNGHTGVTIPSGTRVATIDGKAVFETNESKVINAGTYTVEVEATAQAAGTAANDYAASFVNVLLDPLAFVESVENITTSGGGSAAETDDQLRERIRLVPATFSNAGSKQAYRFWAKTASPLILDVGVTSLNPGEVDIYPLVAGGVATQEILDLVEAILTDDKVRPLTDTVVVDNPTVVSYQITAALTLYTTADEASVFEQVTAALTDYKNNRELTLGLDIVKKQIENQIMSVPGVYNVTLSAPAADTVIAENEFAKNTLITLTLAGRADG